MTLLSGASYFRVLLFCITYHSRTVIAQSVQRWAMGWTPYVRFPTGARNFSLHHRVHNGSGAHPGSYLMGTRGSFPGGKAAGRVKMTTRLHLVSRSKNQWSYTSTPPVRLHSVVLNLKKGPRQLYLLHIIVLVKLTVITT
jgi:hypothetical protein